MNFYFRPLFGFDAATPGGKFSVNKRKKLCWIPSRSEADRKILKADNLASVWTNSEVDKWPYMVITPKCCRLGARKGVKCKHMKQGSQFIQFSIRNALGQASVRGWCEHTHFGTGLILTMILSILGEIIRSRNYGHIKQLARIVMQQLNVFARHSATF